MRSMDEDRLREACQKAFHEMLLRPGTRITFYMGPVPWVESEVPDEQWVMSVCYTVAATHGVVIPVDAAFFRISYHGDVLYQETLE